MWTLRLCWVGAAMVALVACANDGPVPRTVPAPDDEDAGVVSSNVTPMGDDRTSGAVDDEDEGSPSEAATPTQEPDSASSTEDAGTKPPKGENSDDDEGGADSGGAIVGLDPCLGGACECDADSAEPNEIRPRAAILAELRDAIDSHVAYRDFSIASEHDVDWYRVPIRDRCCDGAGDPHQPRMTVTLEDIPEGHDYQLGAWFFCETGRNVSDCEIGTTDRDGDFRGCTANRSGNRDEQVQILGRCGRPINGQQGDLYVQVTAHEFTGTCGGYTLQIDVI